MPWFEFGGECVVECAKSGHSAKMIFHAKVCSLVYSVCIIGICQGDQVICASIVEPKCVYIYIYILCITIFSYIPFRVSHMVV